MTMEVRLPTQPFPILTIEKLGLPRVLEILHTCDWTSPTLETDSLGSFQDPELDFELNAFADNEQNDENGSEKDVDYMERMMAMLLHARGNLSCPLSVDAWVNGRHEAGDGIRGSETTGTADIINGRCRQSAIHPRRSISMTLRAVQ